jgi:hypothetical protein
LIPIINRLLKPVQSSNDPDQAKEILEGTHQALVDEALAMQRSGTGSIVNYVSMRLPKVLLLS